jgi:hypothetical protein
MKVRQIARETRVCRRQFAADVQIQPSGDNVGRVWRSGNASAVYIEINASSSTGDGKVNPSVEISALAGESVCKPDSTRPNICGATFDAKGKCCRRICAQ